MARRNLCIAAVLAALCCWPGLKASTFDYRQLTPEHVHVPGALLLHGLDAPGVSYAMPGSSVWTALFHHHLPPPARPWAAAALSALGVLLVFALGRGLRSAPCGLLSAFLAVRMGCFLPVHGVETLLYCLLVLLVALLLLWRADRPTPRRGLALGLAVGASLLARSPLFLFPLCLGAWEWFSRRQEPRAERVRSLLPLLCAPVLMLLPWIWMNAAVHGRFIPLEDTRVDENVVAGALGIIPTLHGHGIREAAGLSEGESAFSWAAAEVARHPLRYAASVLSRLSSAAGEHPVVAVLALAALWLRRGRQETFPVALLAAYFLAIHCTMGIEPRYFVPLWPILAALAAAAVFAPVERRAPPAGVPGWILWPGFASAMLFAAVGLACAAAYPVKSGASLDQELLDHPRDPWLWSERGRRRLLAGDPAGAVQDLGRALLLDPDPRRQLDHAWALLVRGGRAAGLIAHLRFEDSPSAGRRQLLLAVAAALRADRAGAELALERAIDSGFDRCGADTLPTERETKLTERLCSGNAGVRDSILEFLAPWPPRDRARALGALSACPRFGAVFPVDAAESAAEAGQTRDALTLLDRAASARPDGDALLAVAALYGRLGRADRALATVRLAEGNAGTALQRLKIASLYLELGRKEDALRSLNLLDESPAHLHGASWLRAGAIAFHAGDPAAARRFVAWARAAAPHRRLQELPLGPEELLAAARLLDDLECREEALALLLQVRGLPPGARPAGFWLDAASTSLALHDERTARGLLARAVNGNGAEERRRIALLHRELGEDARALTLLQELIRDSPPAAALRLDLAETAVRVGDRPLARLNLAAAASSGLPKTEFRRAAGLQLELGNAREALRLYAEALRSRPRDADLLIEKALAAAAVGDRRLAEQTLDQVSPQDAEPERLLRLAAAYQQAGRCGRALRLLEHPPAEPALAGRALRDRGICRSMLGDRTAAVADLEAALRSAPGLHSAALTLGALYEAAGRKGEAVRVYRNALRAAPARGEETAAGLLRARLREL